MSIFDFSECENCGKYHDDVACRCDSESSAANRIKGSWKVSKLDRKDTFTRVRFSQDDQKLVHVNFHNRPDAIEYREGLFCILTGWQKVENRHNVLSISVDLQN